MTSSQGVPNLVTAKVEAFSNQVSSYFGKLDVYINPYIAWLNDHSTYDRVAMVGIHFFRTLQASYFMVCLPYSKPVNAAVALGCNLFYYATVEKRACSLRFVLVSFAGGVALNMMNGRISPFAHHTIMGSGFRLVGAAAFMLYSLTVVLVLSKQNVEAMHDGPKHCPKPPQLSPSPSEPSFEGGS